MRREKTLAIAIEAHRKGKIAVAERLYRTISDGADRTAYIALLNLCTIYNSEKRYESTVSILLSRYKCSSANGELSERLIKALAAGLYPDLLTFEVAKYFFRKLGWRNYEVSVLVSILIKRRKFSVAKKLLNNDNLDDANLINKAVLNSAQGNLKVAEKLLSSLSTYEFETQRISNLLNLALEQSHMTAAAQYVNYEAFGTSIEYDLLCAKYWHKAGNLIESERAYIELFNHHKQLKQSLRYDEWATNYLALLIDKGDLHKALKLSEAHYKLGSRLFFSNYLFLLNYSPYHTLENWWSYYAEYDSRYGGSVVPQFVRPNSAVRKIGFVSADFCNHVAMRFLLPFLESAKNRSLGIYLYSNSPVHDSVTDELKKYSEAYRLIYKLKADAAATTIKKDEIDLLVDLSGHSSANRLDVFAKRPAGKSATWIGYGCTTGLKCIDYFFGDGDLSPIQSQRHFSEKIVNLKTSAVFNVNLNDSAPDLILPSEKYNYITYGCLTRLIRINDEVLKVWALILARCNKSRLVLDQVAFENSEVRSEFNKRLIKCGLDPSRVILRRSIPYTDSFNDIDIILDPFPHNGGTSTVDALIAGRPVVSMLGDRPFERISYSILKKIAYEKWVASSLNEYVVIALNLANDLEQRRYFKKNSRKILTDSYLCRRETLGADVTKFIESINN